LYIPSISDANLNWRPVRQRFHDAPDSAWKSWLLDPGSLTERLIHHTQGAFRVQVAGECWWQGHSTYLTRLLGSRIASQRMWSRKVVLVGEAAPWVVAHTLVPVQSLNGPLSRVRRLRSRPLGAFLFSHPGLQRPVMHVSPYTQGWGRCSKFELYGSPVLVAEFFLPALVRG
jgi:chorismate--pyruvate lyase